jgi:hypothetical protein
MVDDHVERSDAPGPGDKYPQYALEPPDGPVVAIDIETCEGWES